jgi:pilus assembly protein CpaB
MSHSRPIAFLALALLIAFITSVLIYKKLQGATVDTVAVEEKGVNVVVAASDVAWGTKLIPDMIKVLKFPAGNAPEGHFEDIDVVKGRINLANLKRGEAILESKLAPANVTTGGVAAVMNPAKRAMAVKVDEIVGVAGFIKPSDRVDVMVTMSHAGGAEKLFTKLLLENVLVLATGADIEKKGKDEKPTPVTVITLEVSPEEAEKLALATTEGKLRLALRNPQNSEEVLTSGATVDSLLSSYQLHKSVPVPRASKPSKATSVTVDVIKGAATSQAKF